MLFFLQLLDDLKYNIDKLKIYSENLINKIEHVMASLPGLFWQQCHRGHNVISD
jgi:hypothetical protein